jgi:hypothetical protein
MTRTKEELIELGKRWSSQLVLQEAEGALLRWGEDLPLLIRWGFGSAKRARLAALVSQLEARHKVYQQEVGVKLAATPQEAEAIENLRTWAQRAQGILHRLLDQQTAPDWIARVLWLQTRERLSPAAITRYAARYRKRFARTTCA